MVSNVLFSEDRHVCYDAWQAAVLVDSLLIILPLCDSVIFLCFAVRYFVSILVLQSSRWGRESWLLCFLCLPGVS